MSWGFLVLGVMLVGAWEGNLPWLTRLVIVEIKLDKSPDCGGLEMRGAEGALESETKVGGLVEPRVGTRAFLSNSTADVPNFKLSQIYIFQVKWVRVVLHGVPEKNSVYVLNTFM